MGTYQEFVAYMAQGNHHLGNNTIVKYDGDDIVVMYHWTNILRFRKDGEIVLCAGGFYNVTTKRRMNKYLPYGITVIQEKQQWYVEVGKDYQNRKTYHFFEGITINLDTETVTDGKTIVEA